MKTKDLIPLISPSIIILLSILLIISLFYHKSNINQHKDEINNLHKQNSSLLYKNDSIRLVNIKIDAKLNILDRKLQDNASKLILTQKELQALKKKKNEIPTYVKHLSANEVANAFSSHLNTKSPSNR